MTVLTEFQHFSAEYGKDILIHGSTWRYYRLGSGAPVLWLTGGLRRAALGFDFLRSLARRHTVIAPDYLSVKTIHEFIEAFDAILAAEGLGSVIIAGQSYGGMLAQAYLAHRPEAVERLVLSSSGPADYGAAWLPVESIFVGLALLLPEKTVKNMLARGLLKLITVPENERAQWLDVIQEVVRKDLSREDVVSHFAVAADLIKRQLVQPAAFRKWGGRVVVLSAENDITQSQKDFPRYENLFGRAVEVISLGDLGHTAVLFSPEKYAELLEPALI